MAEKKSLVAVVTTVACCIELLSMVSSAAHKKVHACFCPITVKSMNLLQDRALARFLLRKRRVCDIQNAGVAGKTL
jgi:hypothetical protein